MKTSQCQCGNKIFFENSECQNCHSDLGFLPDQRVMSALLPLENGNWKSAVGEGVYRKCQNYTLNNACNWMVHESDSNPFCVSCRLSEIIPDLAKAENFGRWRQVESAKRRLIYSLFWLDLPIIDKLTDPHKGLSFHVAEDNEHYSEFALNPTDIGVVKTGHIKGTITINIAEADSVFREEIRLHMQEKYRTLLGHLRHESGHYYWDLLINNTDYLEEFRILFGDEQKDYQAALQQHYNSGPVDNWQINWVSAYASAHPWEDWAESWAHYLHMIDTLETAYDFGDCFVKSENAMNGQQFSKHYLRSVNIDELIDEWIKLSIMLNEMNRSLGLDDAYPFYMSDVLKDKIKFIHRIVVH